MILRPSLGGSTRRNVPFPLDISGMPTARLAYGLRQLRAGYTGNAIRVRRDTGGGSGDDDEADVAFHNRQVSLNSTVSTGGTLRDFVGSNTAHITTWYNQSGNTSTQQGGGVWSGYSTAPDATSTTHTQQPELISSGVFNKGLKFVTSGGFSAAGDFLSVDNYRLPNTDDNFSLIFSGVSFSLSDTQGLIGNIDNFNDGAEMISLSHGPYRLAVDGNDEDSAGSHSTNVRMIVSSYYDRQRSSAQSGDGKSIILRVSGVETTMDVDEDKHVSSSDKFRIGARRSNNNPFNGLCREVYVFDSSAGSGQAALSDSLKLALERNIAIYNEVDFA